MLFPTTLFPADDVDALHTAARSSQLTDTQSCVLLLRLNPAQPGSIDMSQRSSLSLQTYVTDPTVCAIDRAANIVATAPTHRAQKHHEKAVARCAKSTVEFTRSADTPPSSWSSFASLEAFERWAHSSGSGDFEHFLAAPVGATPRGAPRFSVLHDPTSPCTGRRREGLLPRARRRAAAVHGRRRPRLHPGEPAARRARVPRRVRSTVSCVLSVSLCCSMLHTHRTGMGVRRLSLSLSSL